MKLANVAQTLLGAAMGISALNENRPWWARAGYAIVAVDMVRLGLSGIGSAAQPALGDAESGPDGGIRSRPLKFQHHRVRTIQDRVAFVHQQMIAGTKDPKIYALAREALTKRAGDSWAVAEKDHKGECTALFNEVRKRVRYTWDPTDYDAFQTAVRTLELHAGDCFVKGTLVLRDDHQLVPIESLRAGDRIWGHTKWSTVTAAAEKGILPTRRIQLNNGSSMRLTADHKVWIYKCRKEHTKHQDNCQCGFEHRDLVRIPVSELKPGMVLSQPERIPFGTGKMDAGRAYVEGLYLSDGWSESYRFGISGKDEHPKEAQKRAVADICAALGIETHWHKRYLTVKDPEWARRVKTMGSHAPQKHALSINLDEGGALALLRGILADSGKNTHGSGSTFTTTSRELLVQTRVLLKMAGLTASERYIADHGGLGENPIWRLGIRGKVRADGKGAKLLRVKEVLNDRLELPCFDITTDDHFVWLPEADWTTSQCDDMTSLLGALCRSVGHQVRSRIVQTKGAPTWNHIYLVAKVGNTWMPLDASVDKPAGWEVPKEMVLRFKDFDVVEAG